MGLALFGLLLCLSIYLFITGKQVPSFAIFTFFITEGFQIVPESFASVNFIDFALVYIIALNIYLGITKKGHFALNDNLSKIVVVLLAYFVLELIITVISEAETTDFAFKVFRRYLFIGLYFVIRSAKPQALNKVAGFVFVLTTITLLIYLAQIALGEQLLTGTIEGLGTSISGGESRYRNIPFFFDFALIFTFFSPSLKKLRIPLIILFLVGLIAPLNRGPIIAFVVVMALFLMVEGKVGSLVKYALIAVAIGALSWPILSRRFSKENASSDVKSSLQMRSYKNFNTTGGGSFDYILNHPQYIATGIGMRHEDSQKTFNQFHFYLGAIKVDKATDKKLIQQIDTTDLVWATMLLRLGFVGVALYLIMFFIMLKLFYERRKEPLSTIGLLLVAMYLLNSFASDVLTRPSSFFIYFLVYAYALRAKTFVFTIEKKQQPTTN
jgi:hypothetical protein